MRQEPICSIPPVAPVRDHDDDQHLDIAGNHRGDRRAERAEAEAISAILYPNDAGEHGRLLRLKQEYLFVSAGIYSLLDTFEKEHGENWELLPQFVAIHTNDTHPAMCGPELMRMLVDEKDVDFNEAFRIVHETVSFTNHTVMPEALEKWPINTFRNLLPRLYMFIEEIDRRWRDGLSEKLGVQINLQREEVFRFMYRL